MAVIFYSSASEVTYSVDYYSFEESNLGDHYFDILIDRVREAGILTVRRMRRCSLRSAGVTFSASSPNFQH